MREQPLGRISCRRRVRSLRPKDARFASGELVERCRDASNGACASTACTSDPKAVPPTRSAVSVAAAQSRRRSTTDCGSTSAGTGRSGSAAHSRTVATASDGTAAAVARIVPRQPPAVVLRAAIGDDVAWHVLDDQILATDAERRLRAERQRAPAGSHHDDASSRLRSGAGPGTRSSGRPSRRSAAAAPSPST